MDQVMLSVQVISHMEGALMRATEREAVIPLTDYNRKQ